MTGNYSWKCEPVDYSQEPEALRALNLAYIFYISKLIDMIDSVIFLLKKKFTHLSFLHVFHHGIMPFYTWWGPRYLWIFHFINHQMGHKCRLQDLLAEDREVSQHSSTLVFTQSCIFTTCWHHLDQGYRDISGGRSIWRECRWFNLFWSSFTACKLSTMTATIQQSLLR